jgi:hypothetical protein
MAGKKQTEKTTKSGKSKSKSQKRTALAAAKSVALGEWLETLKFNADKVAAAGEPVGACLVTDPHTGTESCVLADQKTCKALRGTFIGGPCGG